MQNLRVHLKFSKTESILIRIQVTHIHIKACKHSEEAKGPCKSQAGKEDFESQLTTGFWLVTLNFTLPALFLKPADQKEGRSQASASTRAALKAQAPVHGETRVCCPQCEECWVWRTTYHHQEEDFGQNSKFEIWIFPTSKTFGFAVLVSKELQSCFNGTFIIVEAEIIPLAFQAVIKLAV